VRGVAAVLLALASLAGACGGGGAVPAAPEPLRPPAREAPSRGYEQSRTDCDPLEGRAGLPPLKHDERSIEEAENLANQGFAMLQSAERGEVTGPEQERLIEQAVDRFITALLADPYNVHATYNLAAAYARIKRGQCSVNLLTRLVPLRELRSQRARVEEKLDRLFGRGAYKGRLDPDFLWLRDDARFRELAKDF
jgi:hypothetical protein